MNVRAHETLDKLIRDYEFHTILDFGCGVDTPHRRSFEDAGKKWFGYDSATHSKLPNGTFDCVWMCHVLEHTHEPIDTLKTTCSLLNPNGVLAITVPPMQNEVLGGHVNLYNAGILLYQLVLAGFNCSDVAVKSYGTNISVIVKKPESPIEIPKLHNDIGDIELLAPYLPTGYNYQGFDGRIQELNWDPMKCLMGEKHRQTIIDQIPKRGKFLEWGCGGSTLWFERHLPKKATMVSVENDPHWANKIQSKIGPSCKVILAEGKSGKNATIEEEDATNLDKYIKAADRHGPFDVILVDGVARQACLQHAHKLLKPNGQVFVHDYQRGWYNTDDYKTIEVMESQPDYPKPTLWRGKQQKLLWVMNVCWTGGTAGWVLDGIKALKSYHHDVLYLYNTPHPEVVRQFQSEGVQVKKVDKITKDLVDRCSPDTIILSNTSANKIECSLESYHTVNMHHSYFSPKPKADVDVFVSKYLKSVFDTKNMKEVRVVPPGISTQDFYYITRPKRKPVVGQLASPHIKKFPKELFDIASRFPDTKWRIMGLKEIPDYAKLPNVEVVPYGSESVRDFLKSLDIFVYRTAMPDTWARTVTEAMASGLPCIVGNDSGPKEQIDHDKDGYVCKNDEEFVTNIEGLIKDADKRRRIGNAARLKARNKFDSSVIHKVLEPNKKGLTLYNKKPKDFSDTTQQKQVILCGGHPSIKNQAEVLNDIGLPKAVINNTATLVNPNIWFGMDKPENYDNKILTNKVPIKIGRLNYPQYKVANRKWRDWENTWFVSDIGEEEGDWLDYGPLIWWKDTFKSAIQILYRMGYRQIYLCGCGFNQAGEYAYGKDPEKKEQNARLYNQTVNWLRENQDYFLSKGLVLINCTPGSAADFLPSNNELCRLEIKE